MSLTLLIPAYTLVNYTFVHKNPLGTLLKPGDIFHDQNVIFPETQTLYHAPG